MNNKVTAKMIRKAAKLLEKHKIKPDEDKFITIKNPRVFRGKLISIKDFWNR